MHLFQLTQESVTRQITLIQAGHEVFLFVYHTQNFAENEILNKVKIRRYYCSNLTYKLSALAYTFPLQEYNV